MIYVVMDDLPAAQTVESTFIREEAGFYREPGSGSSEGQGAQNGAVGDGGNGVATDGGATTVADGGTPRICPWGGDPCPC